MEYCRALKKTRAVKTKRIAKNARRRVIRDELLCCDGSSMFSWETSAELSASSEAGRG